jgi:hypothetical protein
MTYKFGVGKKQFYYITESSWYKICFRIVLIGVKAIKTDVVVSITSKNH